MAWTTPATYTTGEIVTASKLNTHIRDNLRYLKGLDGGILLENTLSVNYAAGTSSGATFNLRNTTSSADFGGIINFQSTAGANRGQIIGYSTQDGLRLFGGGPGRMVIWGASSIDATPLVVVPSGVSRRWYAVGVVYLSSGTTAAISVGAAAGVTGNNIYIDGGTNQLVANTSGTALQIFRNAGSLTYDVIMSVWYQ